MGIQEELGLEAELWAAPPVRAAGRQGTACTSGSDPSAVISQVAKSKLFSLPEPSSPSEE